VNGILRIFLPISLALLATLLVLRFGWPELVVKQSTGYALSLAWPFALFLGLGLWRNLSLGTGSAGTVIVYISTAIAACATSIVLNLGFFDTAPTRQTLEMFCISTMPIVLLVWWKMLWRGDRK
jgi:hypothetical protein